MKLKNLLKRTHSSERVLVHDDTSPTNEFFFSTVDAVSIFLLRKYGDAKVTNIFSVEGTEKRPSYLDITINTDKVRC